MEELHGAAPAPSERGPKLLDILRETLRSRHYGRRTEQTYVMSVKRFIYFHKGRHHIDESLVQKAVRDAVTKAGLTKRATCHTFRHSLAIHLLEGGYDLPSGRQVFERSRNSSGITTSRRRWSIRMSSTADRLVCAARLTGYEVILEVIMPIRIRRHDKTCGQVQRAGSEGDMASVFAAATASYVG